MGKLFSKFKNMLDIKKLVRMATMSGMAMALTYVEGLLPPLVPGIPVKMGLANVFTLLVLMVYTPGDALLLTLLRCTVSPLLAGAVTSMVYSLAGGLASWGVMTLLLPLHKKGMLSPVGMSVMGSFVFNLGQILVGVAMLGRTMFLYFPFMSLLSVPTGMFVGFLAWMMRGTAQKLYEK